MGSGSEREFLVMDSQNLIELFVAGTTFFAFVLGYRQGRVG